MIFLSINRDLDNLIWIIFFLPNFNPYYGSMIGYPSQIPPFNGYMPMVNENFSSVGASEFPEFTYISNRISNY